MSTNTGCFSRSSLGSCIEGLVQWMGFLEFINHGVVMADGKLLRLTTHSVETILHQDNFILALWYPWPYSLTL